MSQVVRRSDGPHPSLALRFDPPVLRPGLLVRPRLMRTLLGRWQSRVTVVAGGAGLGKTTLLAQAVAENRLAPRGEDLWIDLGGYAAQAEGVARVVAAAVGGERTSPVVDPVDPQGVADALWRRSPTDVCMVFDDVHVVEDGSADAGWLRALIEALPTNAHVVLATRRASLPVPVTRFDAQGAVLRLDEGELCLDDEELARFAAARGVDASAMASTGGWPALAELAALAGGEVSGAFVREEVLGPLGPERRRALAVLCDLGGGDDELLSAALGRPTDLARVLDGVPLVARHADGWHVPHGLWQEVTGSGLEVPDQQEVRTRAVAHLVGRELLSEAFRLVVDAGLWDLAPDVLRVACLTSESHRTGRLERWLADCPDAVQRSLPGRMAAALHTAFTTPAKAVDPLRDAAASARAHGDDDLELCAIAQLGRLGWFAQDPSVLGAELGGRVVELAAAGHGRARALAAFGRATLADIAGDDATVLAELSGMETGALDPAWDVMACWLHGMVKLGLGDAEAVCELVGRHASAAPPALRTVLDGVRLRSWWAMGRVDEVLREAPGALGAVRAAGVASGRHLVATNVSILFSQTGDVARARACLAEGTAAAAWSQGRGRGQQVRIALATASLQLAEGDEDEAASTLRRAIEAHGLDRGIDRRGWRQLLALTYVLVPETRDHWDRQDLRGYLQTARSLAAAVVAGRTGAGAHHLERLDLPDTGIVQALLPYRFAAELAVGLVACGRDRGAGLLDALGTPGREAVRSLTTSPRTTPALAKRAGRVLAGLPATPPHATHLAVLGHLALRRGDGGSPDGADPQLRRRRVQELLAFLVSHRTTTRAAISAALWPELDEDGAANNLSVTLSHLLAALEPWRRRGEASYLVRLDGPRVNLATGDHLHVDIDDFDDHVTAAARAEAHGSPSTALDHDLAAVALYRGDLYGDLPEAVWFRLDREHYRTRFVATATRAAQLCLGRGDSDQAEHLAERALDIDPWAEAAHGVLVAAALARNHHVTARRRIHRCLQALDDLGVQPSPATRQLQQRLDTPSQP